ncbi:MAG: M14 family zinc carboxypeptidase [Bacteroidetes bacterium]|nr:M14 family zinc carboxypeptidase [Bacteroidota bacterium]
MRLKFLLFQAFLVLGTTFIIEAQTVTNQVQDVNEIFSVRPEAYFTFQLTDPVTVHDLTRMISVDNVKNKQIWAYANEKEFRQFLKLGIQYTILKPPCQEFLDDAVDNISLKQPLTWDYYPTYPAYESMMSQYETNYPALCRTITIGTLSSGRKLLACKISSNVDSAMNKPRFLYVSSIHGDELTCYVQMLRLIDLLLSGYGTNPRYTRLLDSIEIYICPLANPDGTYHGGNSTVNQATRENGNGVDMNRNFPDPAGGPHPDGNAWQEETVYFMEFASQHHFVMSANFHGGAEVVNYPWDTWSQLAADDNWWNFVGREFADTVHVYNSTGYFTDLDNGVTNGYAWYEIEGGRQDYMNYWQHCRESTIEVSSTKKPPASQLPNFWNYLNHSLLNYMEQCLYGVRGIVTDSVTGDPLRAKVFIQGHDFDSSEVYSALPVGNYHRFLYPGTYNLTFSHPGYYSKTINVQVSNYSIKFRDVQLVPITAGIDSPVDKSVRVYPNPARGIVRIDLYNNQQISRVEVFSLLGETIDPCGNNVKSLHTLDVSCLIPGVYFLKVTFENNESAVSRIVKE